jgi:hypothetical protein
LNGFDLVNKPQWAFETICFGFGILSFQNTFDFECKLAVQNSGMVMRKSQIGQNFVKGQCLGTGLNLAMPIMSPQFLVSKSVDPMTEGGAYNLIVFGESAVGKFSMICQ